MPTYPEYREIGGVKHPVWTSYSGVKSAAMNCITEEPYDCNKCLDCCFSTISKAAFSYEITDFGSPPEPLATILSQCPGWLSRAITDLDHGATAFQWFEELEYTDASPGAGVRNNCASGNFWQAIRDTRVAVREVWVGEDVTYTVVCDPTYVLPDDDEWSYYKLGLSVIRSRAQGDCCGFTMTGGSFSVAVSQTDSNNNQIGDAYIVTWTGNASVEITNNQCCLDAEGNCQEENPVDCDGTCDEGI